MLRPRLQRRCDSLADENGPLEFSTGGGGRGGVTVRFRVPPPLTWGPTANLEPVRGRTRPSWALGSDDMSERGGWAGLGAQEAAAFFVGTLPRD